MSVPLRLAARYLFSRRSGNVTGRISAVSVAGMAIGTAALILVLSVYNGFGELIESNLSSSSPDWVVSAVDGGSFTVPQCLAEPCGGPCDTTGGHCASPFAEDVVQVIRQRVFASYDGAEGVVMISGRSDAAACSVSADIASALGVRPARFEMLSLYFPDRFASISMSNPASSLHSISVHPSMIFAPRGEDESGTVILPADKARELLGYGPDEVDELHLRDCPRPESLREGLQVLDRYQQHRDLYKMMRSEKAAIFLILVFVIFIVAFNIYTSLKLLLIEKEQDRFTLASMGATGAMVRRVFLLEGVLIAALGMAIGLVAGVALALLQQKFGLISMPGNSLVSSYPVALYATDVFISAATTLLVGTFVSLFSTRKIQS